MKRSKPLQRRTPLKRSKPKPKGALVAPAALAGSDLTRRALARVLSPYSDNTRKAYRLAWAAWSVWARAQGVDVAPINPVALVTFLEGLGKAPGTIRTTLAALSAIDRSVRELSGNEKAPVPVRASVVVRQWLRSWSREVASVRTRKAPPLDADQLSRIVTACDRGSIGDRYRVAMRDRLLLIVGWLGALRASEIVALDFEDVRASDRGLELSIRKSKTDQAGAGVVVALHAQPGSVLCPVNAWGAMVQAHPEHTGAVFTVHLPGAHHGKRLSIKAVERIVKQRARAVGIEASPHSLRGGFATTAGLAGHPDRDIQAHGRWKSAGVMRGYMQRANAWTANPTKGIAPVDEP